MTQVEVNKIISAKAMGECWHKWKQGEGDASDFYIPCGECGVTRIGLILGYTSAINPDFSTWEHWGRALEWAQKQKWWRDFYRNLLSYSDEEKLLSPIRGSLALAEFVVTHPEIFGEVK